MTTELFRRKSDLQRNLMIGGGIAAAGAVATFFFGPGGAVLLIGGVIALIAAYMRSRQALVTLDARSVLLRFAASPVTVPFKSIARAEHMKNHDIELCLHSGSKVLVQLSMLEESDGAWLRKELRREIRAANA